MPVQQETTLPNVFADRLLEVPDYQRPYAWTSKQLEDLWEDLDLLGPKGHHYFGTLVLRELRDSTGDVRCSVDEAGTTLRHTEVVDGQQRLTTSVLLLDRVRHRLDVLGAAGSEAAITIAENLKRSFGLAKIDNVAVPRLRLGQDLNDFWVGTTIGGKAYVGPPPSGGQVRLAQAATFFDARLATMIEGVDAEEAVRRLKELQRRVTAGLRVLVYHVSSAAEVGIIFETLNERGRPLTELEKTKNYLLYLARLIPDSRSEDLADRINTRWSGIFRALAGFGGDPDDQLLRVHWLATQNPDLRTWHGVASVKRSFDRSRYISAAARIIPAPSVLDHDDDPYGQLDAEVTGYIDTLHDAAYLMAEMFHPTAAFAAFKSGRERVKTASRALFRTSTVASYRPLLCAARLAYPEDGDFYADLVETLEKYSARVFVILQRRTNAGQTKLARLAYDLFLKRRSKRDVLDAVAALQWLYAPDAQVRATLESDNENWYVRRGHKYFLYEYELSQMGAGEQIPDFSDFVKKGNDQRTTEHILPQNPDPADECWWGKFTEEEHVGLRHALGNLVLTLDNSSYGRKCFDQKRGAPLSPGSTPVTCYAQSSLHQERELAAFEEWTPDMIRKRQQALADWALKRWEVAVPGADILEPEGTEPEIESEGDELDLVVSDPAAAEDALSAPGRVNPSRLP